MHKMDICGQLHRIEANVELITTKNASIQAENLRLKKLLQLKSSEVADMRAKMDLAAKKINELIEKTTTEQQWT